MIHMHSQESGSYPYGHMPPHLVLEDQICSRLEQDELCNNLLAYYQSELDCNQRCLAYLDSLGISLDLAQQYGLGLSSRTLGSHVQLGKTYEGGEVRGALQHIGLLKASGHELFRSALVVPTYDQNQRVTGIFGRRIAPKINPGTDKEMVWSSGNALFNAQGVTCFSSTILCQNPLDALVFIAAGYSNVVATLGLKGFDLEHLLNFAQKGVQAVTMVFENTSIGHDCACMVSQGLSTENIVCRRAIMPEGTSLSDLVRPSANVSQTLKQLLAHAIPCMQTYEQLRRAVHV